MITFYDTAGLCNADMIKQVGNQFDAVLIASNRIRELKNGHRSMIPGRHGNSVKAIQEIEQGAVGKEYLYKKIDLPSKSHHRGR